ncbi:hypothetical protein [Sphingomonas sp. SORGH_AS_0438]|uniref:hypothetical protein n=1 Tax=Sphingomonas sp. SORGH_AS_0438 TaxID=3041756 RepID=UPI002869EDB8|nr:hypothetical protein [Sphingomonas sp. SORGH_AS_0438]
MSFGSSFRETKLPPIRGGLDGNRKSLRFGQKAVEARKQTFALLVPAEMPFEPFVLDDMWAARVWPF